MPPRGDPLTRAVFFAPLALMAISMASSMPILMDRYNEHPASKAENRDDCVICHVNADGSGKLTAFGKKYDRENLEFTAKLIREYPNLFNVGQLSDGDSPPMAKAHPDDPSSQAVIVPGNEPFDARKYFLSECKECHGKYGDGDPFQGVPAFATEKWLQERSHKTEELLRIILYGKDKMKGQAGKINEEEARELLELIRLIAQKYS